MSGNATQLLTLASRGDQAAAARLTPLIYDELRQLARRYLARGGGGGATLQPTAVVHEAYLRLVGHQPADLKSQTHFFALAAVAMRQVLIDHARGRNRAKRGGDWRRITLGDALAVTRNDEVDFESLQVALDKLAEMDARAARVVELRFFAGLTDSTVAELLDVSERTVRNDWTMARAWLRCELSDSSDGKPA
ncbi:MAG: sigma-70 family RNA polymerase sigma factor [bacterium]|nr:sigma-70 family RNA polymerase sigma factor [bacterium]